MAPDRPTLLMSVSLSDLPFTPERPDTPPPPSILAKDRFTTLPSPPLSPQEAIQHFNTSLSVALGLPSQEDNTLDMSEHEHFPADLQNKQFTMKDHGTTAVTTPDLDNNLSSQPVLPSILRIHHENMKLQEKKAIKQQQVQENQVQEQQPPQSDISELSQRRQPLNDYDIAVSPLSTPPLSTSLPPVNRIDNNKTLIKDRFIPFSDTKMTRFENAVASSTLPDDDPDDENHNTGIRRVGSPIDVATPSYHSSGVLIRAKSFSMFESSSDMLLGNSDRYYQLYSNRNSFASSNYIPGVDFQEIVVSTRDWIKMQTRINSLETDILHVTRTNKLLHQELDRVSGHLQKLTSTEGDGWRKEYEFLVQQVGLMHRQLQIAYSQGSHGGDEYQGQLVRGQPEMTRQLRAEVKDLTASLKTWQVALQKAEEKYRQKCDGERILKQTLREREGQLSKLMEKLSGYENEFKKTMSNYEQLARLTSELEALDDKRKKAESNNKSAVNTVSMSTSTSTLVQSSTSPLSTVTATTMDPVIKQSEMPGLFPNIPPPLQPTASIDHLTVSILSWAILLVTYILS